MHSGDRCDLASTLCKYDLRKGDLIVLSWAMVQRVRRGIISSELLMYMAQVCFYVWFMIVCGSVGRLFVV